MYDGSRAGDRPDCRGKWHLRRPASTASACTLSFDFRSLISSKVTLVDILDIELSDRASEGREGRDPSWHIECLQLC